MNIPSSSSPPRPGGAGGVYLVFAVTLLGVAALFLAVYAPKVRADAVEALERELALRANERQTAVTAWFVDRLFDVRTIAQFPTVRQLVGAAVDGGPGIGDSQHMGAVLSPFMEHQGLDVVYVVDARGGVVSSARNLPVSPECARAALEAPSAEPGAVDVHAHPDGTLAVQFVVDIEGTGGKTVAESASEKWLCPLVSQSAGFLDSAEWHLVHREGNEVAWICARTIQGSVAQESLRPIESGHAGAVAASSTDARFGRYVDYRGTVVFAATRPVVPDWGLVLKVDEAEVMDDVQARLLRTGVGAGVLLLGLATIGLLAWLSRERSHELSIARARARQASLIEQANEVILFISPEGTILDANGRAAELYGRPREELLGLHIVNDLRAPAARENGPAQLRTVARGGSLVFETVHQRRDGTPITVEVSSTLVQGDEGPVIVSMVRDVRGLHAARRRDARLARVLRAVSEANHLLLRSADPHALLTGACRLVAETGGFDLAWIGRVEADGRLTSVAAWGHAADAQSQLTLRWDATPEGQGPSGRAVRSRAGVVVPELAADPALERWRAHLLDTGFRSANANPIVVRGEVFAVLTVLSTEPEAFDAETAALLGKLASDLGFGLQAIEDRHLRAASEAQFRTVFDNAALGIALTRLDGRLIRANQALCGMLASSEERLRQMRWQDLSDADDLRREGPLYEELSSGMRDAYRIERRFRRSDGRSVYGAVSASLVRDEHGAPAYAIALVEDVTERRGLQERFLQSQKMESIGRLAGGVAHDFNNLLTAILGYAELLRSELQEAPDALVYVDEIAKAGARASSLTAQLLAFARRQVMEPRLVDLNAVVADAERLLRRLLGEDVAVEVALAPHLPPVLADPGQLHQVLLNLVVNARDAMPAGGRLTLETSDVAVDEAYARTQLDLRPGRFAMLAVSDTGAGIPRESRPHLFEPFYTTKGPGKGTGLGLATSHGIVSQSGGFITVYSEVGTGTTFRVYLPAAGAGADAASPGAGEAGALRGGNETILLAEDEPAVRQLAALSLRSYGYGVLVAGDGHEALALARSHAGPVHLLVTDVMMPGMAGRELARQFAELRPEARVLFMSGHAEHAIAHHGVLEPGVAFLPKPFTPERLARRVRETLDEGASGGN